LFQVVIADESHFLKNGQAKRTSACLPVIKKAQYAILLSGTPALSRPIELFKQLEALYPDVYRNIHEYGGRYCKGVSPLHIEKLPRSSYKVAPVHHKIYIMLFKFSGIFWNISRRKQS
jgi:hypothetical protein